MNRITRMTEKGAALIMAESYESQADAKKDVNVRFRRALEKLYAYEELGLDPDEIADLLKASKTIRSRLNTEITWRSPQKEKPYKAQLGAVEISRDPKTDKLHLSAKLIFSNQRHVVYADINHIDELKNSENEMKVNIHRLSLNYDNINTNYKSHYSQL